MHDDLAAELPPLSRLALAYAPRHARHAHGALLALDARLASILRQKREPLLTQMRLAWWRDTLGEPPSGWPRGDPQLDAFRSWRDPAEIAALVDGWEVMLGERLDAPAIKQFAEGRERAFAALARQLDRPAGAAVAGQAARVWALADLAANLSDPGEKQAVLAIAREHGAPPGLPRVLRPLAVLAGLGHVALARGGTPLLARPADMLTALRIGMLGR